MTPSSELLRDFCAGIGPLQLGVVLVLMYFFPTKRMEMIQIYFIFKLLRLDPDISIDGRIGMCESETI